MPARDRLLALGGFAAGLAVLGALFWILGVEAVLAELAPARPRVLALLVITSLGWLFAWSLTLVTVLGSLGHPVSIATGTLVFAAGQFANNVTPFGQAGGEPVTALFISNTVDAEYETSLAAIASADAVHLFPSVLLGTIGLAVYAVRFTVGPRLREAAVVLGAVPAVALVLGYASVRHRTAVESAVARVLTRLASVLGRTIPGRSPPDPAWIRARIEGFSTAIGRIAADRRRLAVAGLFSMVGWLCLAGSLWLSLYALGHQVSVAAVLVIVPVSTVASVTPLPGGLGAAETVVVVLLVSVTAVSPVIAGATVVLDRLATFWLPTGLGGGSALALGSRMRGSAPE